MHMQKLILFSRTARDTENAPFSRFNFSPSVRDEHFRVMTTKWRHDTSSCRARIPGHFTRAGSYIIYRTSGLSKKAVFPIETAQLSQVVAAIPIEVSYQNFETNPSPPPMALNSTTTVLCTHCRMCSIQYFLCPTLQTGPMHQSSSVPMTTIHYWQECWTRSL